MKKLSKLYPTTFKKIQAAFKILRKKNIYAQPKALDFDSSGCQDVIFRAAKENPSLRGGVYWNDQAEYDLDSYPIIHLGFTACGSTLEDLEPKVLELIKISNSMPTESEIKKIWDAREEERKKIAIEIGTETVEALKEAGIRTTWNGCICTTIQMGLDDSKPEAARPCVCEKIWQIEFARKVEAQLG